MTYSTVTLLSNTGENLNVIGEKVNVDYSYGNVNSKYTISISVMNFTGRVFIEGTLETNPQESDWFPIHLNGMIPYIEFPNAPTIHSGTTEIQTFQFEGKFSFLRARLDRSYLEYANNISLLDIRLGYIDKINLTY